MIKILDIIISNLTKIIYNKTLLYPFIAMPITLIDDHDVKFALMTHLRKQRKSTKLSREALAQLSGVPAPTIKKFETTGDIALRQFLKLWLCLDDLNRLYELTKHQTQTATPQTIDEVLNDL